MAIERASPEAGDVEPGSPPALPHAEVAKIAEVTIYAGQNVFAVGPQATVSDVTIAVNDWAGLRDALSGLGFQDEDLDALPQALSSNGKALGQELGPETKN